MLLLLLPLLLLPASPASGANSMEVWTTCGETFDGFDWPAYLQMVKESCVDSRDEGVNERLQGAKTHPFLNFWPSVCAPDFVIDNHKLLNDFISTMFTSPPECANAVVVMVIIELTHWGTVAGGFEERLEVQPYRTRFLENIMREMVYKSYILDASKWPVISVDALSLARTGLPWEYNFFEAEIYTRPLELVDLDMVTFLCPRCEESVGRGLLDVFPDVKVVATPVSPGETVWKEGEDRGSFKILPSLTHLTSGAALNFMLHHPDFAPGLITTPFVFLVTEGLLPASQVDLLRLIQISYSGKVPFVSGPLVDTQDVYVDFSYRLEAKHWRLTFEWDYEFGFEAVPGAVLPPCKLNDLTSPSFLARTSALVSSPLFTPQLTSEWMVLDWMWRTKMHPAMGPDTGRSPFKFAFCPAAHLSDAAWPVPHLWGRKDYSQSESDRYFWFSPPHVESENEPFHLRSIDLNRTLQGSFQAREFLHINHLKEFVGPDGHVRNFGCHLRGPNCDMSWMYKGFMMPPCCRRTLARLMEYIHFTFKKLDMKYMITDGALLGALKFGRFLDWDGDVDLHVRDEDFDRIETELLPQVLADGYYLRPHENGRSWLLQANDHNYLLVELNKRGQKFDDSWQVPLDNRLYRTLAHPERNVTEWYGTQWFEHGLRSVFYGRAEDSDKLMLCSVPGHHNCVDDFPSGQDCREKGLC